MAVYGLKLIKADEKSEVISHVVTSGVTITRGDTVNIADGQVALAGGTEDIYGVAQATVVGDGTLTCPILIAKENDVFEIDNDNDTNTFAGSGYGAGKFFDLTGTTGALLVDTSSASTTGQLYCTNEAPNSSDTSLGWFKIAQRAQNTLA